MSREGKIATEKTGYYFSKGPYKRYKEKILYMLL